jgi:hypothetical protein
MKTIAAILLIVGIILVGVGVFQWQDGLNMQKVTSEDRSRYTDRLTTEAEDRIQSGEDKEVIGLTLLAVGGVVTIGSGIVLLRK